MCVLFIVGLCCWLYGDGRVIKHRVLHTPLQQAIGSMAPGLWPYYKPLEFEFKETKLRAVWNPSLTRPLIVEFYIDDCLTYTEQYPPLRGFFFGGPRVKCNRIVEYSPGLYYYLKKGCNVTIG